MTTSRRVAPATLRSSTLVDGSRQELVDVGPAGEHERAERCAVDRLGLAQAPVLRVRVLGEARLERVQPDRLGRARRIWPMFSHGTNVLLPAKDFAVRLQMNSVTVTGRTARGIQAGEASGHRSSSPASVSRWPAPGQQHELAVSRRACAPSRWPRGAAARRDRRGTGAAAPRPARTAASQPADCVASVTTPAAHAPMATAAWMATAPPNEWPTVTKRSAPLRAARSAAASRSRRHRSMSFGPAPPDSQQPDAPLAEHRRRGRGTARRPDRAGRPSPRRRPPPPMTRHAGRATAQ